MTTSLAQQLRKLALPESTQQSDQKKKVSLLFDPSKAASLDRDKFYNIGREGLEGLIELEPAFFTFSDTLFDLSSQFFERTTESKDVNKNLNKIIQKFLRLLSPYLLLKHSHKALEWLICRYQIHNFNVEDLMALIIPYHESKIFVKILQLINLNYFPHWKWLDKIKKKGVHLPKSVLVNHAFSDSSFLRFICDLTLKTISENKKHNCAKKLGTLFTFYGTTLITFLSRETVNDHHLTIILPSLVKSLKSDLIDFKASGYMILGQLVSTNQITADLLNNFMEILLNDEEVLINERILLLVLIFQTQKPPPTIKYNDLEKLSVLSKQLPSLANEGVQVGPLVLELLEACFTCINDSKGNLIDAQVLSYTLATEVTCNIDHIKSIIRLIDSSYEKLMKDNKSSNSQNQDSTLIKWIKELMNAVFEKYRENLDVEVSDKEFKKLKEKWESPNESMLKDPVIIKLIKKCQGDDKESAWLQLRPLLLEKVHDEKIFEALCKVAPFYDNLVLLLCLQKLIHPKYSDEKKLGILSKIFKSKFGGNNFHIQEINNLLIKNKTQKVSEVVESYFLQLKDSENVIEFEPWLATLLEMKEMEEILDTSELWCFGLKILLAALPKAFNATYALQLMSILLSLSNNKGKKIKNRFEILKSVIAYISGNKKKETKWFDLSNCDSEVWLKVRVLEYVIKGVHNDVKYQKEYNAILDEFSKGCFFGQKEFVRLLGAVCCGLPPELELDSEYEISVLFQIYSLHTSWLQLKVNDEAVFDSFKTELSLLLCYFIITLSNNSAAIRQAALKVLSELLVLLKNYNAKSEAVIFEKLLIRSEEILSDPNQVSVALYCLLSPSESVQATLPQFAASSLGNVRSLLLETITAEDTPLYVSLGVMQLLETVNSSEIVEKLYQLSNRAFLQSKESEISRKIIVNFWSRIDESTVEVLENEIIWDFAKRCIKHEKCENSCPSVSFLKCITREVFEKLTENKKIQLLEYMIEARSETESSVTASAIASVVKKISFDCQIILPIINNMISLCNSISKRREKSVPQTVIDSKEWKNGISLLELIQSKKKLLNTNILIQPLFNMLKFCLDQDEQIAFEYTKQLLLGCLLDCCKKFSSEFEDISENTLNVELVVQCLRASPNPQTHHHALMLLSYLSALIPTQVLRNVMAIFTFMGTSVARLDDEHSVKVVTRVVESVVPELVKAIYVEQKNLRIVIAEILRVFVWAIKDIPHHRRNPLLLQLLTTMQPENCLWIFLLLLFENHISQSGDNNKTESNNMPTNLYLGLELSLSTSTKNVLDSVVKIFDYLEELPVSLMNKEGRTQQQSPIERNEKSNGLFDIDSHTPKQLRHFCYTILTFLNNLLGDSKFVLQVRTECESDKENVELALKATLASLLKYIPFVRKQLTKNQTKFWKAMTHQCYEILDKFVLLTPSNMLLNVIKDLLNHPMKPLRRKALDLLNSFIQSNQNLTKNERQCLKKLLEPTIKIVNTIAIEVEQEEILLQQTALLTLKLLAKLFCPENTEMFKKVLINICSICESKKIQGPLLGSLMLTIAELVTCLKAYSVSKIPSFMPLMLNVFSSNSNPQTFNEIGLNSITVAIHRVIEVIPNFLSPYLGDILFGVCTVSVKMKEKHDLIKKFVQIRQKLASNIEHRILIPAISKTYKRLIENKEYQSIGPLFDTLSSSFSNLTDIPGVLPDVSQLFISALSFRSDCEIESVEVSMDDINKIEENVINSLVHFVLKLSESSFKSLYYQIFHWASEHRDRTITFFRLSHALAENLKGLFVLFAGYFLQKAADLLDATNTTKTQELYFSGDSKSETKSIILLQHILQTLHSVFLYDSSESSNFLNKDKFEVLLHPLVDQLENTLGGIEELEKRTATLLTPCLAQMALATDDTLWKSLNYEILLKTKSSLPQIRIGALETIVAIASKLCEDYLMLLPETIGSLAELLEDEDERVENAMKNAIQKLEDVLGQPVREYFQ